MILETFQPDDHYFRVGVGVDVRSVASSLRGYGLFLQIET